MRRPTRVLQGRLHIRKIVHQIRGNDVVEWFLGFELRGLGLDELQILLRAVTILRHLDELRTEIHAHAFCGVHGLQEVTRARAQFENPHVRRDKKAIKTLEKLVVEAPGFSFPMFGPVVVKLFPAGHGAALANGIVADWRVPKADRAAPNPKCHRVIRTTRHARMSCKARRDPCPAPACQRPQEARPRGV